MKKKTESQIVPKRKARSNLAESGGIVQFAEDGLPQLDVWLEDETIWLTQRQMALLFDCAPQNITYHLREIFKIGELEESATCKEFLQVQIEGSRHISRMQKFYNLDAVISVGYRVNSIRGVKFRQWATAVLKEFLLRGSVRDRRLGKLEKRVPSFALRATVDKRLRMAGCQLLSENLKNSFFPICRSAELW